MKPIIYVFIRLTAYVGLMLSLTGCFLLGIHVKVHNPKKQKAYPNFSQRDILLGELNHFRRCYDVNFYGLDLTIEPDKKEISGQVSIKARATMDFDTLQLDLHPDLEIDEIAVKSGQLEVNYTRKFQAVLVSFDKTVEKDLNFELIVRYHGKPPKAKKPPWKGGFVWKKDKEGYSWVGVASECEGASLWWPCKDHSSDEADSVLLTYTVPGDLIAVGNGVLIRERDADKDGNRKEYTWRVQNPINTYNITCYAGNFKLVNDSMEGELGRIQMNHYVLRNNAEKARRHFQQAKKMIAFFESAFGPYPWYQDGFKLVEAPYEGMEHQSGIAYGSGYKNFASYDFDYIILHESAHEWWGNSVTALDFADIWLQEGFATYAEALYVENQKGKDRYRSYLLFERLFIKNRRPVIGPVDRRFFDYKDSDVYMKGAWILHTLRNTIENDSIFFDLLKSFAVENRAQLVTSNDFIHWVNKKTQSDYTWFFDHYLKNREAPMLQYYFKVDERNQFLFFYRWKNSDIAFKLPVSLRYKDRSGRMRTKTVIPGPSVQSIVLENAPSGDLFFRLDNDKKYYGLDETKKILR